MQWTDRVRQVKIVLVVIAVVIAVASLLVSHLLVSDLKKEERNKMEVWVQALNTLNNADETTDLTLALSVIQGNNTIPVVVLDAQGEVMDYRNLDIKERNASDSIRVIREEGERMRKAGRYIRIDLGEDAGESDNYQLVCYDESLMLKRLASYPYVQLGVVMIFVVVAIFALVSTNRAEQNKV